MFTTSGKTDITLRKSATAVTMCRIFTRNNRYHNSIVNLIGNGQCPNEMISGKICVQKRRFNQSAEAIINVLIARPPSCLVRNIPFLEQLISFFLMCDQ